MSGKFVKVCPKCGSKRVVPILTTLTGILPTQYKCLDCNFSAFIFPEVKKIR